MDLDIDDQFGEAAHQYTCGNFEAAAALFQQLVAAQHAPSATYLSQLFLFGEGVALDPSKAVELLKKGILWGDWNAAFNLAAIYHSGGYGIPRELARSRQYFLIAKELGCPFKIDDEYLDDE